MRRPPVTTTVLPNCALKTTSASVILTYLIKTVGLHKPVRLARIGIELPLTHANPLPLRGVLLLLLSQQERIIGRVDRVFDALHH